MNNKEMNEKYSVAMVGGTTYEVENDSPVVFWRYTSSEKGKDEKITHLVCVDCVDYVKVELERKAPTVPLLGCLESGFPYDYVEAEVEGHPVLEDLSMEDGGKWLYYSELEREYLVCSHCEEVFLTYWPETRSVAMRRQRPYIDGDTLLKELLLQTNMD